MSNKPNNLVGMGVFGRRSDRSQLVVSEFYAQDCTSRETADESLVPTLSIEPLTQKSLERLAGAACLWNYQAHLSSCESGFRQAACDEPDSDRRSA